jgi:pSer/pThr/pTyr-binding forkhead associated (FHA) protein
MWLAIGTSTRELRDGELVVGGGADADWRVASADLMPRHFTILVHGLNASLRPSSVDNVVVVNGKQLGKSPHALNDGDEILAGGGRFLFSENEPRLVPDQPDSTPRAFLIDDTSGTAHELINRSTQIGRDPSNAIIIDEPTASRFHAEVRREAGGYALHSMGSAGTQVNEAAVSGPVMLSEGDTIELAYCRLRFSTDAGGAKLASAASPHHERLWSRRNPTLATAKISVVQPDVGGGVRGLGWLIGVVVIAIAIAAYFLIRSH